MSVRGERVVYRERDEYEEPRRTYTTVKRYQVPEPSSRSVIRESDDVKEDKIIIRRERRESSPPSEPKEDIKWKVTERVSRLPKEKDEEIDFKIEERIRERERPREEIDYKIIRDRDRYNRGRDIAYRVLERDSDWDRHSAYSGRTHSAPRTEFKVVERDREIIRAPSPPSPVPERIREFKFERERSFSPPPRRSATLDRPYDLERYSKSTEYFAQPQPIIIREPAPQPIIIRERSREPQVIIREERREPNYEFIEREEVKEQSLVKREEPPPPEVIPPPAPATVAESVKSAKTGKSERKEPEEESYFYERRVREVDRSRRRDESYDRKTEIRPRDSASQYSSDDSYEYVRRERTYDGERDRDRSHSPNHRRHLAEGAIAGVGAAEILRHHRRSEGKPSGGRFVNDAAGGALGAIGAEALSRVRSARSKSRVSRRSRSRSRSWSDDDRDTVRPRRRRRSRSRSKSLSRAQQLGGLAAVAAVGALAGYVIKKNNNKETVILPPEPRRSRSRRRRASVDSYYNDRFSDPGNKATNPEHRNRRIAQAGLASAAAAGIWDRVRSKSRGARSKSRVRQGVPIAAAGLGGAALAGLYENSKANKERQKEAIIEEEAGRGRRRRSRSRSRSVPASHYADDRRVDDQGLIAYGNEPIYPDQQGRGYYSDEEPGMYRRRHRGGSSNGSSPDTRRRSRSRGGRSLAEAGAAAGIGAAAGHELGRQRERSRQRDGRGHDDRGYQDPYYDQDPVYSPAAAGHHNGGYLPYEQTPQYEQPYGGQQQQYPSGNYFPPPPTGEHAAAQQPYPEQQQYQAYNPADYAQGGYQQQPYPQTYGQYGESDANLGAPHAHETYAGDQRGYGNGEPAAPHDGRGRNPENVSAPTAASAAEDHPAPTGEHQQQHESQDAGTSPHAVPAFASFDSAGEHADVELDTDGLETPRAERSRSRSRVRFDMDQNTTREISPEKTRSSKSESSSGSGKGKERAREEQRHSDSEVSGDRKHRRRRRREDRDGDGERRSGRRSRREGGGGGGSSTSQLMNDKYERDPDSDSEGTVDLPPRFDEHGNRKDDGDSLEKAISGLLGSRGVTDFLAGLGGGGSSSRGREEDDEGRSGRRRGRH